MTPSVTVRAYAKINWVLELLGKREDGYHEIRTVTQTISLCDELTISVASEGIAILLTGQWTVPDGPDNICWRATEAFREAHGAPPGVRIRLDKRVPVGAGLGGGSSDCVAVLMALGRLTGIKAPETVRRIAASLGSDTMLFLDGGMALCAGRGEIVSSLPCPRVYDLVIARPACRVATRDAYAMMSDEDFGDGARVDALVSALTAGLEPRGLADHLHNAFRERMSERFPQIEELANEMLQAGALGAEMTGSGSAVFGVAPDASAAQDIARRLTACGYWSVPAHTVDSGFAFPEETEHA